MILAPPPRSTYIRPLWEQHLVLTLPFRVRICEWDEYDICGEATRALREAFGCPVRNQSNFRIWQLVPTIPGSWILHRFLHEIEPDFAFYLRTNCDEIAAFASLLVKHDL